MAEAVLPLAGDAHPAGRWPAEKLQGLAARLTDQSRQANPYDAIRQRRQHIDWRDGWEALDEEPGQGTAEAVEAMVQYLRAIARLAGDGFGRRAPGELPPQWRAILKAARAGIAAADAARSRSRPRRQRGGFAMSP